MKKKNDIPYSPECEKLAVVHEESQHLGAFLYIVLSTYGELCVWREKTYYDENGNVVKNKHDPSIFHVEPEGYYPTRVTIEQILADYFKIDMNLVNEERAILLKYLQEKND